MARKTEMRTYAAQAEAHGIEVVSSWIWREQTMQTGDPWHIALQDLRDLGSADTVVVFGRPADTSHGGRWVEFGIALSWLKQVVLVEARPNTFCHLTQVRYFVTFQDYLSSLFSDTK